MRRLFGALLLALVPLGAWAQVPTIQNTTVVPSGLQRYGIARIQENAPLALTWSAQLPVTGTAYEYELSVDTDVLSATVSPEQVRLTLGTELEAGEANGPVYSGQIHRFIVRPLLLIPADHQANGPNPLNDQQISIILSVFPVGGRVDPNRQRSATFAWTFRYDTKLPPAPVITRVLPGDKRLLLTWNTPSDIRDLFSFEVLWNHAVSSTTAAQLDPLDPPYIEQGLSVTQTDYSVTTGLTNGVPAAVAVRSVDPYGNVGNIGDVHVATPVEVLDYFELYKSAGGEEQGGFCFIATAAYGSYSAPMVHPLRAFRDLVLGASPLGRVATWYYYQRSPLLARQVAQDPALAARARSVLAPVAVGVGLFLGLPLFAGLVLVGRIFRRRQSILGLLLVFGLLTAGEARAERPKPTWPVGLGLEFKGGPFLPALAEDEASQFPLVFGAKEADQAPQVAPNALFQLGLDLQLYRGIGTAGIGGSFGFMQFIGRGYFAAGNRSQDTTVFNLLPLQLTAFYRFDWLADQVGVPLVPYARGGLAYSIWWVTGGDGAISRWKGTDAADADDVVGRGGKIGLVGTVGLAIMLNGLEPGAARSLYESTGIRGTYLFGELTTSKVDGFGSSGFDLSGQTWAVGISIER